MKLRTNNYVRRPSVDGFLEPSGGSRGGGGGPLGSKESSFAHGTKSGHVPGKIDEKNPPL